MWFLSFSRCALCGGVSSAVVYVRAPSRPPVHSPLPFLIRPPLTTHHGRYLRHYHWHQAGGCGQGEGVRVTPRSTSAPRCMHCVQRCLHRTACCVCATATAWRTCRHCDAAAAIAMHTPPPPLYTHPPTALACRARLHRVRRQSPSRAATQWRARGRATAPARLAYVLCRRRCTLRRGYAPRAYRKTGRCGVLSALPRPSSSTNRRTIIVYMHAAHSVIQGVWGGVEAAMHVQPPCASGVVELQADP